MKDSELYWLVGLLEGEGCFLKPTPSQPTSPGISLQMTDEDIVAKVSKLIEAKYHFCKSKNKKHKDTYRCLLRGYRAVELMKKLRPHMGKRRKNQIDAAIYSFKPKRKLFFEEEKISIVKEYIDGNSAKKVAKKYGIRRETVHRLHRKYKCIVGS